LISVIIRSTDTICVAFDRKIFTSKEDAYAQIERMRVDLTSPILGKCNIIVNYETEYCERNFDIAVGVELIGKLRKDSKYAEKIISFSSDMACLVCNKAELENAYVEMIKYLEEAPCQIIGAFYEIYYDDGTVELKVPVRKLSHLADKHKNDDISILFENDVDAVGKWEFIDLVPSEEQFNLAKVKYHCSVWLNELYFLPKGEWFWAVSGWTKDYLFTTSGCPERVYKNKYTIKMINNQQLLFLEMKDYENEARGGVPTIWIYKKVSDKEFSRNDIRIRDNVDFAFESDVRIIGRWIVNDFVLEADNFNPSVQNFTKEQLFFISAEFKVDGSCIETLEPTVNRTYAVEWTKVTLLDKKHELASAYEIRIYDGTEYLFIEWKSGDYEFGGRKPYYYVFIR